MIEPWYEIVGATTPISQGDVVLKCPLLNWTKDGTQHSTNGASYESPRHLATSFEADVVVLTQACDLEQAKVANVVLCPHLPLDEYRKLWQDKVAQAGQNPSEKAWRRTCEDIANGYVWNQAFLNSWEAEGLATGLRVVDFHEIYTLPRTFLESLLIQRNVPRLRLRPPYREHLSQAFARFFMRVGLPTPLDKNW